MGSDPLGLFLACSGQAKKELRETILSFLPMMAAEVPTREGILDQGQEEVCRGSNWKSLILQLQASREPGQETHGAWGKP